MVYRPTWQGHLKLSLVTCPVAIYTASNSAGDVHLNLINPKTNNRINMMTTDPDTNVVDLTAALPASLGARGKAPAKPKAAMALAAKEKTRKAG